MSYSIMIAVALLFPVGVYPSQQEEPSKPSVPDKKTRETLEKDIRELFKSDYTRRDRTARRALAEKLIAEGERPSADTESKFVFLDLGWKLAGQSGDAELAFSVIHKLATAFDFKEVGGRGELAKMRKEVVTATRKVVKRPAEARELATACLTVVRKLVDDEDYVGAEDLAKQVIYIARSSRDKDLYQEARELPKEIKLLRRESRTRSGSGSPSSISMSSRSSA